MKQYTYAQMYTFFMIGECECVTKLSWLWQSLSERDAARVMSITQPAMGKRDSSVHESWFRES